MSSGSTRPSPHVFRGVAVALGGATLATAVATHPAIAAGAFAAVQSAVTCATTVACVSGTNTGSGPGVTGTSAHGTGISAQGSTGVAATGTTGIKGTGTAGYGVQGSSAKNDGVFGYSSTGTAGVAGSSPAGYGVYGFTTDPVSGVGVLGSSGAGYGTYGTTLSGAGYGAVGTVSGAGIGVYGHTASGYGIEATSSSGYAIFGQAFGSGNAAYLRASAGGFGLIAYSAGNPALYANNSSGNAGDFTGTYIGLIARTPANGYPLVATDQSGANNLFYVDGAGNVSYRGGLFHFSAARGGAVVKAFGSTATSPTVEDTGTAQLVAGAAAVRLDPAFAASIETAPSYRVFVTPGGDTRGLYVAAKTPSGFVVRESQGGRSTVSFDYRVVATALGQTGQHIAVTTAAEGPRATAPVAPVATAPRPGLLPTR